MRLLNFRTLPTVIIVAGIVLITNYQYLFKTVVPPVPVIVSSDFDGSSTRLFEFSAKVHGDVRNDGGDGYIVIEAEVNQDKNSWKKTMKNWRLAFRMKL